ncbi:MAG: competence/damage-inducible protein A [Bacteroidetes bacterium]|nr:MAG: competence/damage-inducible protein A [Bacteroidota bacterium]
MVSTAAIITIGNELLIGQIVDTNSAYIGQQLTQLGIDVKTRLAVGDTADDITHALQQTEGKYQVVILTGGLGPTADDVTKPLLNNYFGGQMVLHTPTLTHLEHIFAHVLKRPMIERNRLQAMVPSACEVMMNDVGTAPGMRFYRNGTYFFSLPGVPFEMQFLMTNRVLPFLKEQRIGTEILHKTLLVQGIGESFLADELVEFEQQLPKPISLAYLPNHGLIRLRLTGKFEQKNSSNTALLEQQYQQLRSQVQRYFVADGDVSLQKVVTDVLLKYGKTMCTAESCTGGFIASNITQVAGSSAYYNGSVVCYSNNVKQQVLQVPEAMLAQHGAVSEPVVKQLAEQVRILLDSDYSIAVSGIMGPDGGTPEKPVGTVWVAVSSSSQTMTHQFHARFSRAKNIELTAQFAFGMLRKLLLKEMVN